MHEMHDMQARACTQLSKPRLADLSVTTRNIFSREHKQMECPPSSPPRLLPGFAPNKSKAANFQIYQDSALLPTPLPTSERDVESPGREAARESPAPVAEPVVAPVAPARRALEQLKTIKLRPDVPVLVGRSSRACEFVLKCSNKLVSRIHARVCYEAASDLVTVECLGWNGLSVIVPGKKGSKEYPVIRNQTIYIEKVNGIEISIQGVRTFVEVASGPSETTEDEVDFKNMGSQQPDSSPLEKLQPMPESRQPQSRQPAQSQYSPDVIERTIAALKARTGASSSASPASLPSTSTNDSCKENVTPKRVHFACDLISTPSKVELSRPRVTTLAEYRERRRSLVEESRPDVGGEVSAIPLAAPFKQSQGIEVEDEVKEAVKEAEFQDGQDSESQEPGQISSANSAIEEPVGMAIQKVSEAQTESIPEIEEMQEPTEMAVMPAKANEPAETPAEAKEPVEMPAKANEPMEMPAETNEPMEIMETAVAPAEEPVEAPVEAPAPEVPVTPVTQKQPRKRKAAAPTTPRSKPAKKPRANKKAPVNTTSEHLKLDKSDTETFERLAANCVAFSRLNSTPLSHIIASSHELEGVDPSIIAQILQEMACIGVIQREGKDALGKPLEPEYYYISELDPDTERKQMVVQSKGGKSLRACRRTHKQYFYKRPK